MLDLSGTSCPEHSIATGATQLFPSKRITHAIQAAVTSANIQTIRSYYTELQQDMLISPEIFLGYSSTRNSPCLNKVFQRHVINALGCQDDIGTSRQDLLDPLLGDVKFPLPDLFQLFGIAH